MEKRLRYALVGPKSAGKTSFKLAVAGNKVLIPGYIKDLTGITGFALHEQGDYKDADHVKDGGYPFQIKRPGTSVNPHDNRNVLKIKINLKKKENPSEKLDLLDFPGEVLTLENKVKRKEAIQQLTGCTHIIFMLPFWAFLPQKLLKNSRIEGFNEIVTDGQQESWFDFLEQTNGDGRMELVIVLTMFGHRWYSWFNEILNERIQNALNDQSILDAERNEDKIIQSLIRIHSRMSYLEILGSEPDVKKSWILLSKYVAGTTALHREIEKFIHLEELRPIGLGETLAGRICDISNWTYRKSYMAMNIMDDGIPFTPKQKANPKGREEEIYYMMNPRLAHLPFLYLLPGISPDRVY